MGKTPLHILDAEFSGSSDRAAAVVAAAFLDAAIRRLLEAAMIAPPTSGPDLFAPGQILGTFMAKANLAFMLGLIDESERKRLSLIARIRNEFAHIADDVNFDKPEVKDRCRDLAVPADMVPPRQVPPKVDMSRLHEFRTTTADPNNSRSLFEEATLYLLYVLYGREAQAATRRPVPAKAFNSPGEPAGEVLVHAILALRRGKESGQPQEVLAELQSQVDALVSVVVHAEIGRPKQRQDIE